MAVDSDILSQLLEMQKSQDQVFRDIDRNLQYMAEHMSLAEAENARATRAERSNSRRDEDTTNDRKWKPNRSRSSSGSITDIIDDFGGSLADQLEEALFGSSIQDQIKGSLTNFANALGIEVEDIPKTLGKLAGNSLASAFKETDIGKSLSNAVSGVKSDIAGGINNVFNDAARAINPEMFDDAASSVSDLSADVAESSGTFSQLGSVIGKAGREFATTGAVSAETAASLAAVTAETAGVGLVVVAALVAIDKFTEVIQESWQEVKKSATELSDAMDKASNRAKEMLGVKLEQQQKRQLADFNAMIEKSYDVMQDAATKMLDAWDSSLKTISATQGYTKAGVQELLSNYAQRLRDEGLSSVVSTADITTNLQNVLEAGLSGQVAEEFAYLATKLNAAIPTEDFFQYASTYASVAANAIAAGKSQQEAIEYANAELEQFASNLLYSSRELAGGFSTGLKGASDLFESANKIAVASRTGQASEISGVLTAVSAAIGAVAPDLASGLVDNVVSAALGGNTESVTALRSLSGVGASNTAFLQALATDAQGVFETLFSNLANLQSMSKDNYMEVAEGLSSIFGISMDAFARVDFSYLADVIGAMSIDGESLGQNLSLLVSGQTTYTAEQARIAEINQVMIEEGLAYVLDNEVARSIQENMWAEQRAQELMENEFAVNLQGKALELMNSIANLVDNILGFLNPLSHLKDMTQLLGTIAETNYKETEIEALLQKTVVGIGNSTAFYNLTHRGTDLNLTESYLDRLGGADGLAGAKLAVAGSLVTAARTATGALTALEMLGGNSASAEARTGLSQIGTWLGQQGLTGTDAAYTIENAIRKNAVASSYTWGTVGKSSLASSGYRGAGNAGSYYAALTAATSAQDAMTAASQQRLNEFLGTMDTFVQDNKSFEEWQKSASKYGILDLEQALSDFGLTMQDAKDQFVDYETAAGIQKQQELREKEQQFWDDSIQWYETTYPEDLADFQDLLMDMHDDLMSQLVKSHRQLEEFYDQWIDYYVNHTAYSRETLDAYSVAAIRTAERSEVGDSVLALAEALTSTSIDLKDPAVQTNVLLAKILMTVEAIMQQTNDTTTVSLPTALASLGLGYTTETTPRV